MPMHLKKFLCRSPLQIINALQRYGLIGLDYDYSRAQTTKNQASQAKWTQQRERKMADICRREFGGLPSCMVLRHEKSSNYAVYLSILIQWVRVKYSPKNTD